MGFQSVQIMFERAPGYGVGDGQAVEEELDKEETRRWTRRTLRWTVREKWTRRWLVRIEMDRGRQGDTDVTRRQGGGHWTVKKNSNFLSVCLDAL